jgi:hypothetical protein
LLKYKEIKKNMNTEFEYIKYRVMDAPPPFLMFEATAAAHDKLGRMKV